MTHLEFENLLSDYLEGQLAAGPRTLMEEHLAGCAECRESAAAVRQAMELCRSAEDLEPSPWLVSRILLATVGQRKPTLGEQLAAFFRPVVQPRVAYGIAMVVFSFSIIINAAGISLRRLTLQSLNPRTWVYQTKRNSHLLYARAEKFYYDLRVVYEIESRLRQLRSQPAGRDTGTPKQQAPGGGSTDSRPPDSPQLASVWCPDPADRGCIQALSHWADVGPWPIGFRRSTSR